MRMRDQTGAMHLNSQYIAPQRLMRNVIMERHWLNHREGDQPQGSQLKLLQMIDQRRRRGCWRYGEGLTIEGLHAEPLVPVVGITEALNLHVSADLSTSPEPTPS